MFFYSSEIIKATIQRCWGYLILLFDGFVITYGTSCTVIHYLQSLEQMILRGFGTPGL